ncbi:glycosyltransferase family 25 protein [Celeribacter sp.]|uniref:glycosyltransferase family 25 protein n=1 Tax=Celeribacter sp. TaxID=1890673 RepID=UPI003A9055DA
MPKLLTLLINLDGSDDRLSHAKAQLSQVGIEAERVPACDARGKSPASFEEYDPARAIRNFSRPMTGGEIGCYKSHLQCVERFLNSDCDYALVLEDDLAFTDNAQQTIQDLIAKLDAGLVPDWELVNLGNTSRKFNRPISDVNGHSLEHAFYFPTLATALLWSRSGAEAFYATRRTIYAPVDEFFKQFMTKRGLGLCLNPPCVLTSGAPSEIDNVDSGARQRPQHTPAYFWAEFKRQSKNYFYAFRNLRKSR